MKRYTSNSKLSIAVHQMLQENDNLLKKNKKVK